MGFWSSVSSFCSSVGSAVSSAASSVGSAISSVASSVWETAKYVAGKAVTWMADKAESFVGEVKEVWKKVRPFIEKHVRPYLKIAAAAVPWPWLKVAILSFEKALDFIEKFENSSFAKKLDNAIKWAIKAARKLKETYLSDEEMEEAEQRKRDLKKAAAVVPEADRHAIDLAALINDYAMVQTAISDIMESNTIKDFEHYLRLRASQKLLKGTEKILSTATSIEEITTDDIFLLQVGSSLLAPNPELSDADAIKLDQIIYRRFGKKLIPFVFEEMVMAWGQNLQQLENEWKADNAKLSKDEVLKRRLEVTKRLSELPPEEEAILKEYVALLPKNKAKLEALGQKCREQRNYVHAAEGFLQTLEKTAQELEADGQEYLADEGSRVGMIIIDCAQNGKRWADLAPEDRSLITDYANIFEKASKARAAQLVEIEVGA